MKPIKLSAKEIGRASEDGITVVVRRQARTGLYMVVVVRVSVGMPIFKPQFVRSEDISKTVREEVRFLSKMSMGGQMADASRSR